jgi:predicted RNA-binding Zn-ribbon protein involved in translation (DUF1610 family)
MESHPSWCELPKSDRPCVDLARGVVNWGHCRAVCPWCGKPVIIDVPKSRWRGHVYGILSAIFCGFGLYLIFVACRYFWRLWL